MTLADETAVIRLPLPAEPMDARKELFAKAVDRGGWNSEAGGWAPVKQDALCSYLWSSWNEQLSGSGIDENTFCEVAEQYKRELWFWLHGDRTWQQSISGLAGRLERRIASAAGAT